jgi:hypothetical protein
MKENLVVVRSNLKLNFKTQKINVKFGLKAKLLI